MYVCNVVCFVTVMLYVHFFLLRIAPVLFVALCLH